MELPVDILSKIDVMNLLAMAAMLWFFNSRLDKKFDKVEQQFDKVEKRFDKVDSELKDVTKEIQELDKRLCRLEGAFSSKDCCMIKDDRQIKKID